MNFAELTVLDGILALIVLIGLFLGFKRGFFESITKPIKVVAAACLTFVLSNPIITAWTRPFFTEKAYGWFFNGISEKLPAGVTDATEETIPAFLRFLADLFKIGGEGAEINTVEDFSLALAAPVGNIIATIVTYLAVFIVLLIILSVLTALIGGIVDSGPLAVVDKILGLILGLAIAIVICCIIANIVGGVAKEFTGGFVFDFFKNFDPFSLIMSVK